jgi:hypothetical protein
VRNEFGSISGPAEKSSKHKDKHGDLEKARNF